MSYRSDSLERPSCTRKRKLQLNDFETLSAASSNEYPTDDSESADDISDSAEEDLRYVKEEDIDHVPNLDRCGNLFWQNDPMTMEQFPFTKSECFLQPISSTRPIDYFRHLLTESILEEIVAQTNNYAHSVLSSYERKQHSRLKAWKETSTDEILAFIGLILHMGTIRINHIQDYWKTDPLFGLTVFSYNMSRNRFLLLMRVLHFAKPSEENAELANDQLCKVDCIVNWFNKRMAEIFYPGREILLDESMVFWRGQLFHKQYIQKKRHRVKLYMITTPNGIVTKFMLADLGEKRHTRTVVMDLLEGMLDVGHSLFLDGHYNSYELARWLADKKTHCTGMINKPKETFPQEVSEMNLKRGETMAKYANGVMIGKWKDIRDVTYISNEYKNDMVQKTNQEGKVWSKPLPVIKYNKCMASLYKQDQLLAYYPSDRKTLRWATKIFVFVLQLMMSNAYLLYIKYSTKNMSLYDFRLSVIRCLLKPQPDVRASARALAESEHVLQPREEKKGTKTLRKQCKSCYSQGKRKDTIYVCKVCDGSPGYCLDCAKVIHT